jgi:hypothetical protein
VQGIEGRCGQTLADLFQLVLGAGKQGVKKRAGKRSGSRRRKSRPSTCPRVIYGRCLRDEEFRYLPAPLVGQLLNVVRHQGHGDFAALHLIAQEPRVLSSLGRADEQLTLWLPTGEAWSKDTPSASEVWDRSLDDDP